MGITYWVLFLSWLPFGSEFSLVPSHLVKKLFHVVTTGAYFIPYCLAAGLMVLLGKLQASSGESRGGNQRSYGPGLPILPCTQRSALPSPKRWSQMHLVFPPQPLHFATQLTNENWNQRHLNLIHWAMAVTAGEWSYLSVPLPFCHRDRRPCCWGRARAVVASPPAVSSWSPTKGEPELSGQAEKVLWIY